MKQLIECVPNISEGKNLEKINTIANSVKAIEGINLLDVDPGSATNRTVITFVGEPKQVIKAAFVLYQTAIKLLNMKTHTGEHPRFGSVDVCPLIPIKNISMEETIKYARLLAEKVANELHIPVYCYENAALKLHRKNLSECRKGEYELLSQRLNKIEEQPDFGPKEFNESIARTGATAIGARDFLIAYNVNLNTTSKRRANAIAFDIRELGRVKTENGKSTGKKILDEKGNSLRIPGKLKAVKGIGWYIEEYGIAQISYNLTNINITSIHKVFEESRKSANNRGLRVTGSELVGLIPLQSMLEAADYYLSKQNRSLGCSEKEKIKIAIKSLGLDDLKPFIPKEKIIEYKINTEKKKLLTGLTLEDFADETASESMAPGGGSIAAYIGVLGISLSTMVANISSHKPGKWEEKWKTFSDLAKQGQKIKAELLFLTDEDTRAFNKIIEAFKLPKSNKQEINFRNLTIENATKYATQVPLNVMKISNEAISIIKQVKALGLKSSISDSGVAALSIRTAVSGAYFNVKINAKSINDKHFVNQILEESKKIFENTETETQNFLTQVLNELD